jgi:hypothetical protein
LLHENSQVIAVSSQRRDPSVTQKPASHARPSTQSIVSSHSNSVVRRSIKQLDAIAKTAIGASFTARS